MKVGCYTLDLYCDKGYVAQKGGIPDCGWKKHMQQFTGRTEASCIRKAKAEGWSVGKRDLCPKHARRTTNDETN